MDNKYFFTKILHQIPLDNEPFIWNLNSRNTLEPKRSKLIKKIPMEPIVIDDNNNVFHFNVNNGVNYEFLYNCTNK